MQGARHKCSNRCQMAETAVVGRTSKNLTAKAGPYGAQMATDYVENIVKTCKNIWSLVIRSFCSDDPFCHHSGVTCEQHLFVIIQVDARSSLRCARCGSADVGGGGLWLRGSGAAAHRSKQQDWQTLRFFVWYFNIAFFLLTFFIEHDWISLLSF